MFSASCLINSDDKSSMHKQWTFSPEHIVNNPGKHYGAISFRDKSLPFVIHFELQILEFNPSKYEKAIIPEAQLESELFL